MPFITQGKTNLKYILIVVVLAAIVGGGVLGYQYWWAAKKETIPPEVKVPADETADCVSPDLSGYEVVNEFFVDFNNDKQNELTRVYAQKSEGGCGAELPIVVKIFSGTIACRKEEFTYPSTLAPITGFDDERYNAANAQLMKNFWGDERDIILVSAALNFCGSGIRSKLLFFSYQNGEYIKVDGPIFGELDYYFLSPHPEGKAILLAQGKWEAEESHTGLHRYTFALYRWDGAKYEKIEIGATKNKYAIDDKNFKAILQNIETIFQSEPEKLQLEVEKL